MTIHDWYFELHGKYTRKYGEMTVIAMQVGQFHEFYALNDSGPDLETISKILNIRKTKKNNGIPEVSIKNPMMIGFPSAILFKHVQTLLNNGFTIVVIDQTTPAPDPKREVTGIYSPGTSLLTDSPDSNFLVAIYMVEEPQPQRAPLFCMGAAAVDLTTGVCEVQEVYSTSSDPLLALDEASRFIHTHSAKEIIIVCGETTTYTKTQLMQILEINDKCRWRSRYTNKFASHAFQDEYFTRVFKANSIQLELDRLQYATIALMTAVDFAYQHNENITNNLNRPVIWYDDKHLVLGNDAAVQLNLTEGQSSIFDVVNHTSTAGGARFLKTALMSPLCGAARIKQRYDCIEEAFSCWEQYEQELKSIQDIERLIRSMSLGMSTPYAFTTMYSSFKQIVRLVELTRTTKVLVTTLPADSTIFALNKFIAECDRIFNITQMRTELYYFNAGIYPEIDAVQTQVKTKMDLLANIADKLSNLIDDKKVILLTSSERDGYYMTMTKRRSDMLQAALRRQETVKITENYTLKSSDLQFKDTGSAIKLTFGDLTEVSSVLNELNDTLNRLIKQAWTELQVSLYTKFGSSLMELAQWSAFIDFIKSGAKSAKRNNYFKPEIVEQTNSMVQCVGLRHPIVEQIRDVEYKPHNISLGDNMSGMLLYGLNSAGKSVLMRAVGVAVAMAQAGLYVAATTMKYTPYKSLYTRIVSNDDLYKGRSLFTHEMTELKAVLQRSGVNTLVLGDEILRSTEYVSSCAIITAVIIKLAQANVNFIFATHLHELVKFPRIIALPNVKPFHLTVEIDEERNRLVYDRILKPGSGPELYGVTVAKYIIRDTGTNDLIQEIKNEIMHTSNKPLESKQSRYNNKLFMHDCQICGVCDLSRPMDTHHINFQENCHNGFVDDKVHLRMNNLANLVVLCKKCHQSVHAGDIKINGYDDTNDGKQLNFEHVDVYRSDWVQFTPKHY